MADDLIQFLSSCRCEKFAPAFQESQIISKSDFMTLISDKPDVLLDLIPEVGPRVCFVNAVESGRTTTGSSTTSRVEGVSATGNRFVGEGESTSSGQLHGFGKQTFERSGAVCIGFFHEGQKHGYFETNWTDGRKYVGRYRNDKMHGKGTYFWPDGRKYDGMWEESKQHGHGIFEFSDGSLYDGEWVLGKSNGHGVFRSSDGSVYDGFWENGKRHGEAVWTSASGESRRAIYHRGERLRWVDEDDD